MNFILSFIGPSLPIYVIECVKQIRLYYNGDLYLIYNDYTSNLIDDLIDKYNVKLIKYDDVNTDSNNRLRKYENKFISSSNNGGRPQLFYRSFERMFIMNELINKYDLTDNIFLEIDNLIYNNPEEWVKEFSSKEVAFMINNHGRCSTALMYIKNKNSMRPILDFMIHYINVETDAYASEMYAFWHFNSLKLDYHYVIPTLYNDTKNNIEDTKIFENFKGKNIYDPLCYGQYILGLDITHSTTGKIILGSCEGGHYVICDNYKLEWQTKEDGLKKPYILNENTNEWILINNLHVHSKDLKSGLSKDI